MSDPLLQLVRQVFELSPNHVLEETFGPGDVPGWDSLGTLRLVDAVEQMYGIELELAEIADLVSIAQFRRIIGNHLGR